MAITNETIELRVRNIFTETLHTLTQILNGK